MAIFLFSRFLLTLLFHALSYERIGRHYIRDGILALQDLFSELRHATKTTALTQVQATSCPTARPLRHSRATKEIWRSI